MTGLSRRLIFALLCMAVSCSARSVEPNWAALARDPTWLRLLHVPRGQRASDVRSPDFFLSEEAPGEPEAELQALRQALDAPWPADPEEHARCRFPARYRFLARHVALSGHRAREPRCAKFERWARFDELRSASVILVSGYFGNPASTFGHALLRLNTAEPDSSHALLDLGFNFGALIPPGELTPVYVYRGLTGGYEAGFSDKYFFSHDQVYARTELRDMWDYELNLDSEQLATLTMHLYELAGRKFTYYFLNQNCAYRLAELIELVSGQPITQRSTVWYTPVELFHRLNDAHERNPGGLIRKVRFVPSAESQLRAAMQGLAPRARVLAREAIDSSLSGAPVASIEQLDSAQQAAVVDVLMMQAQLREVSEQPDVSPDTKRRTQRLLHWRLSLPAARSPLPQPTARPSPADAAPPLSLGLGVGGGRGEALHVVLRGAAFDYAALGDQGLGGGELVVFDTQLAVGPRLRVDQMDFIRVRKLDTASAADDARAWSWQTSAGLLRHGHLQAPNLRAQFAFGAGWAQAWTPALSTYAMLQAAALSDPGALALQPVTGLLVGPGCWRAGLQWSWRRESRVSRGKALTNFGLHARLSKRLELRVEAAHDPTPRWTLALNGYQ